jgi:hypothetical protein
MTQDYHARYFKSSGTIATIRDQTTTTFFELGLNTNTAYTYLPGTGNDLYNLTTNVLGLASPNANSYSVMIDKSQLHLVIRNNENFGCWLKAYYLRPAQDVTAILSFSGLYTAAGITNPNQTMTEANDIREFILTSRFLKVIKTKMYKVMPGEVIRLKLKLPRRATRRVLRTDNLLKVAVSRAFSRCLALQVTGFPLHDSVSGDVTTGSVKLDYVSMYKGKIRDISETASESTRTHLGGDFNDMKGQQWQSGAAGTSEAY